MQQILKAIFAATIAGLGAASTALEAGNGHIGWQSGIVIAITATSAFGGVWGVTNAPAGTQT